MPNLIKNKENLVRHGNREGRRIALSIIEHAINAVNGYELTKKKISINNNKLIVDTLSYDLSKVGRIYVIGAGKASFSIARALDEVLGNRIEEGVVIVKRGENKKTTSGIE